MKSPHTTIHWVYGFSHDREDAETANVVASKHYLPGAVIAS
ncbi:MAG TPA: hypothetical protein VK208_03200 [Pyrinomonadaceae bacterium]|nr:hypothetical protein [Pyrinomonadaceae bacterium]